MNAPTHAVALALGYWKSPWEEFGLGVVPAGAREEGKDGNRVEVEVVVMHLPFPRSSKQQWPCLALEENAQGEEGLYRGLGNL